MTLTPAQHKALLALYAAKDWQMSIKTKRFRWAHKRTRDNLLAMGLVTHRQFTISDLHFNGYAITAKGVKALEERK